LLIAGELTGVFNSHQSGSVMIKKHGSYKENSPISLLIVDDSQAFRGLLRGIFDKHARITTVGESANGIQCLEYVVKYRPDVILMDMEMPLMDGMTALQHLMIHKPTPTIMFSSLTKEGTARSFDALKNGAVDFFCKDIFFQRNFIESLKEIIVRKVVNASRISAKSVEPAFPDGGIFPVHSNTVGKVVFCEECGSREVIDPANALEMTTVICSRCGDRVDLTLSHVYRRNSFITFIGAGEGGYSNLLNIIPKINADMHGSIIVQIYGETDHVDAFTDYLDSISTMRVHRIQDGLVIEGGNCYVSSSNQYISLKPYSAQYTLRCSDTYSPGLSPIDAAMSSIAAVCKDHVAGVILSGNETDGVEGIRAIQKSKGSTFVLDPRKCLCKGLPENIIQTCSSVTLRDESEIVRRIEHHHLQAKEKILTA
jgi:two-component system, chemotaxis family, protein-glutamate methylesterase/glutaminase